MGFTVFQVASLPAEIAPKGCFGAFIIRGGELLRLTHAIKPCQSPPVLEGLASLVFEAKECQALPRAPESGPPGLPPRVSSHPAWSQVCPGAFRRCVEVK